ncbi:response regulator transcription factor [Thauera butanivorans]|uniref:response regulator transcription factor n=1 Tax=Thauera butanivorans TaxID=86174 RepID=UPI003AB232B3
MIEILMVDDHAIFRSGLRRLLSDEPDMRIVAEAGNGREALERLRNRPFGVVLLDVSMAGGSGLDTLRRIHAEWPSQPVVMLSMYPEEQYAAIALDAGANGYVSKDRDAAQLIDAIRIAASGGFHLPAGLRPGHRPAVPHAAHARLTEREWQILRLIVAGVSLTEIGRRLCLSVKTVSTYRSRLLGKLAIVSNAELVRYCIEHGIDD